MKSREKHFENKNYCITLKFGNYEFREIKFSGA